MEQLLTSSGYRNVSSCSCGGVPRRTYYNNDYPDFKVSYYPTRKKFAIRRNNILQVECAPEDLPSKLQQYEIIKHQDAAAAV